MILLAASCCCFCLSSLPFLRCAVAAALRGFVRAFRASVVRRNTQDMCLSSALPDTPVQVSSLRWQLRYNWVSQGAALSVSSVHVNIYPWQCRDKQVYPSPPWPGKHRAAPMGCHAQEKLPCVLMPAWGCQGSHSCSAGFQRTLLGISLEIMSEDIFQFTCCIVSLDVAI